MLGGWDRPDVALAQRDLVVRELSHAIDVPPYQAFLWAMDSIGLLRGTLLDVGCGVGHYGVLCERRYPGIVYHGTDASAAMVAEARRLAPLGKFKVCDFFQNRFDEFDIVLLSQIMEMLPDPRAALQYVLSCASGFLILNRIRLTQNGAESYGFIESTYCGNEGRMWLWNMKEIYSALSDRVHSWHKWGNQVTLVVKPVHDG